MTEVVFHSDMKAELIDFMGGDAFVKKVKGE